MTLVWGEPWTSIACEHGDEVEQGVVEPVGVPVVTGVD